MAPWTAVGAAAVLHFIHLSPSFTVFWRRAFDWAARDWFQSGDSLIFQPWTRWFAIWRSWKDPCTSWVGVTGPRLSVSLKMVFKAALWLCCYHHSSHPTFLCYQMCWCCMFWFTRIFYFNKWLNGVKLPTAPSNKVSDNPSVLSLNHSSSSPLGLSSSVEGCFLAVDSILQEDLQAPIFERHPLKFAQNVPLTKFDDPSAQSRIVILVLRFLGDFQSQVGSNLVQISHQNEMDVFKRMTVVSS